MDSRNEKAAEKLAFHRWKPAAWLRVTGEDAFTFLQGQFTNDLRSLRSNEGVYGLWLNHKGKVVADSFVLSGGAEEFWVGSYFSAAKTIQERLEAFVIADDVTIEDQTSSWVGLTVFSEALVAKPDSTVLVFKGRRALQAHREWIAPVDQASDLFANAGVVDERDELEMERLRIESQIPRVPDDIGAGELPNEGGLDEVGISYTKGCYLGQEVMARLKNLGQVRRRLLRVRGSGPLPPTPAAIFAGDKRIGELRTAVATTDGFVGLALLSLLNLTSQTPLRFSPELSTTVLLDSAL